jgi:glycosyltransferase involved in cell wall biosynthesis
MEPEKLSVIVATRDRAPHLDAMLASYSGEWADTRELLVVDNGSRDGTRAVLERARATQPKLASLYVAEPGQSLAINRGIAATSGPYVAFLDDDILVQPGWARALIRAFETTDCAGIQGRILLAAVARADPQKAALARRYNTLPITDFGTEPRRVKVLVGANMAVRREVLERLGGFDEDLGPGRTGFGADTKVGRQITESGAELAYVAQACVEHVYDPARMTDAFFEDYNRRRGRGRFAEKENPLWTSVLPNLCTASIRARMARWSGAEDAYYRHRGRYFAYSEMLRIHRERRAAGLGRKP